VEDTARLLASLGHRVEESYPEAMLEPDDQNLVFQLRCAEIAARAHAISQMAGGSVGPGDIEPSSWAMAEIGRRQSALDAFRALSWIEARSRRIAAWWSAGFDLLLTPTVAEPPPLLGTFEATAEKPLRGMARGLPFLIFTVAFNQTGQPAISLPLWWTAEGLPIGVQLVAAYGREDLLLRIAAQLEQAQPWADRRPPVSG
jgi:amidase